MRRTSVLAALALCLPAAAHADAVLDWNQVWLDTVRAVGGAPCPLARGGAMVHAAMYDAVNSIDRTHEPYLELLPVAPGASPEAAAAAAAHRVLTDLYPLRAAIYDAALAASLAQVPDGPAQDGGVALGIAAADALMAARANDGTATEPSYEIGDAPGDWRPTPPDFTSPPFNPGWGATMPWSMIDGADFRPELPLGMPTMGAMLASEGYAEQVNEVKALGARDSQVRTAEQTEIAWFWANDRNGTYKPPGHLNQITRVVSQQRRLTLAENARLFALINIAMADAGLVAWDAKYRTSMDLWRPVSAIRHADEDGNEATVADPEWLPLLDFTPPFPAYVSGHATFGAVHAAVMADYFGNDRVPFTVNTDEPGFEDVYRSFSSFSEAALENGRSRIYLGVHYQIDADGGFEAGTALGHHVFANLLQPVGNPCLPGDIFPEGVPDGRFTLADYLTAVRRVFALRFTDPQNACADLAPGTLACSPSYGRRRWCAEGDGLLGLGDLLVLRSLLLRRLETTCVPCAPQEAVLDRRLAGDVAPLGQPDNEVSIGDVVVALRMATGLLAGDAEARLRADVAPLGAGGDAGGDGAVGVADAVLLLRASVGLQTLRWPVREIAVRLDAPVPRAGASVSLGAWPHWAEDAGIASPNCDGQADGVEIDGPVRGATCVSDPVVLTEPGDLVVFRYRAPHALSPDDLTLRAELVDADLQAVAAPPISVVAR